MTSFNVRNNIKNILTCQSLTWLLSKLNVSTDYFQTNISLIRKSDWKALCSYIYYIYIYIRLKKIFFRIFLSHQMVIIIFVDKRLDNKCYLYFLYVYCYNFILLDYYIMSILHLFLFFKEHQIFIFSFYSYVSYSSSVHFNII